MPSASRHSTVFSPLVEQAVELAAQWHEGTYRKGRWRDAAFEVPVGELLQVPVVAHVMTVGMIVQRAGWDDETVAAALLHDALEDDDRHGRTLRRDRLRALVGETVTARVEAVTEVQLDDGGRFRSWTDRKEGYLATLCAAGPEAMAVSLADKLHNLWSINEALARGQDVFTSTPERRGLSAGPDRQRWFHGAVLEASAAHDDPRLEPLRTRLAEELDRFDTLTRTPPE